MAWTRLTQYRTSVLYFSCSLEGNTDAFFSWLFPQIDAALHHGGAGSTGASLRGPWLYPLVLSQVLICVNKAGIPTLIKPWFGYVFNAC